MLRLWWLLYLSTGDGECYNRVTSFLQMIGRNLRRVLYAGFIVSAYWSGIHPPMTSILSLFGPVYQPYYTG